MEPLVSNTDYIPLKFRFSVSAVIFESSSYVCANQIRTVSIRLANVSSSTIWAYIYAKVSALMLRPLVIVGTSLALVGAQSMVLMKGGEIVRRESLKPGENI